MRKLLFLLLVTVSSLSFAARILPSGKLAELEAYQPPQIKLSGKVYYTAPAIQIRGLNNTLLMPGQIAQLPRDSAVWFQVEPNTGFVWRIWVVSAAEAKELAQREKDEAAMLRSSQ
ncbi:hypothetical protein HZU75_05085 [Chitinibacter fontanus]|uniref:Uncharacterized protein n=1 Tax=Chitinibacter fontanus TaxID=1737446 RepID=A0A7D5ZBM6_9NEIS|nr:hypothetical protein [Chitinibacter fontanus]QLI80946.1 hypothetical protein HZU75_05085 [Chitinibacter fontanus]